VPLRGVQQLRTRQHARPMHAWIHLRLGQRAAGHVPTRLGEGEGPRLVEKPQRLEGIGDARVLVQLAPEEHAQRLARPTLRNRPRRGRRTSRRGRPRSAVAGPALRKGSQPRAARGRP